MFDKMVKMKNRKGFTLIEMLVVIAIIAILVAIIVPVVGNSTQKSRAATNAANLRSIEGQIATLMVEYPKLFNSAIEELGGFLGDYADDAQWIAENLFGITLEEYLAGNNAFGNFARYALLHITADDDGNLTISGGDDYDDIIIYDVPTAVEVNVPGMSVAEGTKMTVLISDTNILATYETLTTSYTKMDFAEVAETGEFSGASGSGGASLGSSVSCILGQHQVDKTTCTCTVCGQPGLHADSNYHTCPDCKATLHAAKDHTDSIFDSDDKCDYKDCSVTKTASCSCRYGWLGSCSCTHPASEHTNIVVATVCTHKDWSDGTAG